MDSGAGNTVMPRRMVIRKSAIRESEGSRNGVHYVAANNGRIPNEGEYDFACEVSACAGRGANGRGRRTGGAGGGSIWHHGPEHELSTLSIKEKVSTVLI